MKGMGEELNFCVPSGGMVWGSGATGRGTLAAAGHTHGHEH